MSSLHVSWFFKVKSPVDFLCSNIRIVTPVSCSSVGLDQWPPALIDLT